MTLGEFPLRVACSINDSGLNMARDDETTLAIHGLDLDAGVVRAEVFVQKLRDLIGALKTADKLANGRRAYDYLLPHLDSGSAIATVRARARRRDPSQSPISYLERAATAVYDGDLRDVQSVNREMVGRIEKLSRGANVRFAHAEISFSGNTVIRIDDYFQRQAKDAMRAPNDESIGQLQSYRGAAFGTFDGVLKEIDSRGTMLRGKLVLIPSTTEIDCVMNKDRVPAARDSFDKRVVVKGTARYDGRNGLPVRVDVAEIRAIEHRADLTRWKGAFVFPESDDIEDY